MKPRNYISDKPNYNPTTTETPQPLNSKSPPQTQTNLPTPRNPPTDHTQTQQITTQTMRCPTP
ncbi:hypothetical protein BDV35DRAFT_337768 [Aspergillus flavus]|uniref:Uncharacterized protein n=1 Tax=Aspergillus flavus TaxID=5059 RepID=A0A5N6HCL0_ASPFL|nr:hypothetical protein BDV35DRAFT_337768 [Aspergillus flavus]